MPVDNFTINRTIMELKRDDIAGNVETTEPINRTIMELKQI